MTTRTVYVLVGNDETCDVPTWADSVHLSEHDAAQTADFLTYGVNVDRNGVWSVNS
jgi:hypothetical protein